MLNSFDNEDASESNLAGGFFFFSCGEGGGGSVYDVWLYACFAIFIAIHCIIDVALIMAH